MPKITKPVATKEPFTKEIDGRTYTFRVTTNCLCELEDKLCQPLGEIMAAINRGSMGMLRALIWASLWEHHRDLDFEAVGVLIEKGGGLAVLSDWLPKILEGTIVANQLRRH